MKNGISHITVMCKHYSQLIAQLYCVMMSFPFLCVFVCCRIALTIILLCIDLILYAPVMNSLLNSTLKVKKDCLTLCEGPDSMYFQLLRSCGLYCNKTAAAGNI